MKQKLMTIFARTPISVGAGSSVGAIDLPVMRERHTRIPIIPGSSVKGVLRDLWNGDPDQSRFFGTADKKDSTAGKLFVGEARVIAFPVRSARNMFAWMTCPLALERFFRDNGEKTDLDFSPQGMECCASNELICKDSKLVLEEYCFDKKSNLPDGIAEMLLDLSQDPVWQTLKTRLAVISDDMFSYFVENTCEVPARIQINDETGTVKDGALFYQEQVPSETMFYNVLSAEDAEADILDKVSSRITGRGVLQFGGDETIGLGYCTVEIQ
ncbi:MAG: type III-B CRISPR module RAMP protein Cmr4 [Lentisphaeria bacterium]|nr:type III-B CRISPR module RAMP protein Cmr4 [Lentisphaeria bacterium]